MNSPAGDLVSGDTAKAERRYRSLVTAIAEFVWTADADGIPNAYFGGEALLGSCPRVLALDEWYELVHPEDRARNAREWSGAVSQGRPCVSEFRLRRFDGEWRHMLGRGVPVRGTDGRVEEWVGVVIDMTERKRAEEELRQAQKMEAIGLLAGGVAHDFNNLLTAVLGCAELLNQRLEGDEESLLLVRDILGAADRAASLTRQLLTVGRKAMVLPCAASLNEVVTKTTGMLRRVIAEDIAIITEPDAAASAVQLDSGQLEQILMNLSVNARDAMPQGGCLTVRTRDISEGFVCLSVADTGCGMTEQVKARIFDPFFTTKEMGKGTGLGLAVVYGIVNQAGGRISVWSEPGAGAQFDVYLPRATEPTVFLKKADPPPVGGSETVLLVEDEAAVRMVQRRTLEGAGYVVLEAANGQEAERIAAGHAGKIELLVTDVVMPGMGGRELAGRLTATHPGLKVLYCSGHTEDSVVRHGVLGSQVEFLQKPFGVTELARKVREVLDRGRSIQEDW
jgi:PAS domain S-box-containing protein